MINAERERENANEIAFYEYFPVFRYFAVLGGILKSEPSATFGGAEAQKQPKSVCKTTGKHAVKLLLTSPCLELMRKFQINTLLSLARETSNPEILIEVRVNRLRPTNISRDVRPKGST